MACEAQHSHFLGESIANCASHACGGAAILLASPSLLAAAHARGGTWGVVGASIFIATALLLYLASTLYHAAPSGAAQRVLQRCDHCAIFLLIAGTYTPFSLGVLRGPWGWSLFGAVWGLAVTGVAREILAKRRCEWFSVGLYLAMGWLVLIAAQAVAKVVPLPGLLLLLGGGVAYTLGTIFYVCDRRPYFHFAWHLFVVAGTTLHFFAVRNYAA